MKDISRNDRELMQATESMFVFDNLIMSDERHCRHCCALSIMNYYFGLKGVDERWGCSRACRKGLQQILLMKWKHLGQFV